MNKYEMKPQSISIWILVTTIAMLFGLQNLRVFFPGLMWAVSRNPSLGQLLGILAAVFGLPMFILFFLRSINTKRLFLLLSIGQVIIRFLEQISQAGLVDLIITSIGVFFFISFFYVLFSFAPFRAITLGTGVLFGLSIDTALRGGMWTLDLSWQKGWAPIAFVFLIAITQLILSIRAKRTLDDSVHLTSVGLNTHSAYLVISFGIFIFIQQHAFQDISRVLLITEWNFPQTLWYITINNYVSLLLVSIYLTQSFIGRKRIFYILLLIIGLTTFGFFYSKAFLIIAFSIANFLITIAFTASLISLENNHQKGIPSFMLLWGIGFIIYPLLVVIYYVLFTPFIFVVIISVIFVLLVLIHYPNKVNGEISRVIGRGQRAVFSLVPLLLFFAIVVAELDQHQPLLNPENGPIDEIQVMSINLHQGFDARGNMAISEQALLIETSGADIISMNEVSRGWLLDGSLDIFVWLSHNLGSSGYFGPSMGDLNGNAIFSRFPLISSTNYRFLNDNSKIPRAYLQANFWVGDKQITVVSTHLAWDDGGPIAREAEVRELTEKYQLPGTLILGDMNAYPDYENIERLFKNAGYSDGFKLAGQGVGYTWHALDPVYRLDYIFGSLGIKFKHFAILDTTISDHLPIIATISFSEQ